MSFTMLVAMAAAAMDPAGPKPIGYPGSWITFEDYPAEAQKKGKGGTTKVDISIDELGHPVRCRVLHKSEMELLDQTVCAALLKRSRWKPTLDDAGKPIFFAYQRVVKWSIFGGKAPPSIDRDDIEIYVAKLPVAPDKAVVGIRQIQRADGSEESCTVVTPSASLALDRVACGAAKPLTALDPIGNVAGERVRGVRWRTVRFIERSSGQPAGN